MIHRARTVQGRFDGHQLAAHARRDRARAFSPSLEEAPHPGPEPPEVGLSEPAPRQRPVPHPLPLVEQDVGVGQQVLADPRPAVPPVDHGLEVSSEVRPADLALAHREVVVGRVSVRGQHSGMARDQLAQHLPGTGQADQEHGHAGGHRGPQPAPLAPLRPPGLVHVRGLPNDVGTGLLNDRPQGDRGLPLEAAYGGRADRYPGQVLAQPRDAPLADPVRPAEERAHRLDPRPVPASGITR